MISSIKARRDEGVSGVDADSTSEWAERDAEEEEGPRGEEGERGILPYCPDGRGGGGEWRWTMNVVACEMEK